MLVLVTGGTGFIGSHTTRALRRAGHRVRLLVRSPEKAQGLFATEIGRGIELVAGDVADRERTRAALAGVDAVIHAAAVVSIERRRAAEVERVNVAGVHNVVEGACEQGVPVVVHVSSAAALLRPGGPRLRADLPLAPAKSAYGRSKAAGDRLARELLERGAPIRISYPVGVVGPDDPGLSEMNHMLVALLRDLMPITSSGCNLLDVRDLAALHVALVERGRPGRYLAGGQFVTWKELADLFDSLTGVPVRRLPVPGVVLRLAGYLGDALKRILPLDFPLTREAMVYATLWPGTDPDPAVEALGIPPRPLRTTLEETLRWLAEARHLPRSRVGRLARAEGEPHARPARGDHAGRS